MPDDKMMNQLLASYGAPMNARNANAARQFFASNPDAMERRAMGMRGSGVDDNSDLLDAMLDKVMVDTGAMEAPATTQNLDTNGAPAVQAQAPQARASAPPAPQRGPRGTAPNTEPQMQPGYTDTTEITDPNAGKSPASGSGNDIILPLILSALGITSVKGRPDAVRPPRAVPRAIDNEGNNLDDFTNVTGKSNKSIPIDGGVARKQAEGYGDLAQRELARTQAEGYAKLADDTALANDRKAKLQAEIDAENAGNERLQNQLIERQQAQRRTEELAKAARRATGRR